jgi:hypothetical protein
MKIEAQQEPPLSQGRVLLHPLLLLLLLLLLLILITFIGCGEHLDNVDAEELPIPSISSSISTSSFSRR